MFQCLFKHFFSKNTGYDKRGALKNPNNEGLIDPDLVARHDGESRIDWINLLFMEIGIEGQAYKDITSYVIKTANEDLESMALATIKVRCY